MVDLGFLAVSERLLVRRRRDIGVGLNLDFEDGRVEALRGAKGRQDDGRLERLARGEQLDGKVLLRLSHARQQPLPSSIS